MVSLDGIINTGIYFFTLFLFISVLMSIFSITNAMSGHTKILNDMTPFLVAFPILMFLFTGAFSRMAKEMDASSRKVAVFLFVAVAYIFTMLSLHISCFNIKIVST